MGDDETASGSDEEGEEDCSGSSSSDEGSHPIVVATTAPTAATVDAPHQPTHVDPAESAPAATEENAGAAAPAVGSTSPEKSAAREIFIEEDE
eukprot:TRINITY_DN16858_c0_g1_i2.p1 TRINITY_DN16858_c0_g1~~TRINITY_DN16858_c0_g1_i2.p1  ORF type:complete len:102 (+),score=34.08 TRINITY_DN16858_c0_g1_i2:28-306(+)